MLSFVGGGRKNISTIKSYVGKRNRVNESKRLAADEGQEDVTKKKKKEKIDHWRSVSNSEEPVPRITGVIKTK